MAGTGGRALQELRARNAELEREVQKAREGEAAAQAAGRRELELLWARLCGVEEAEERLSAELGDLEAESVAQARAPTTNSTSAPSPTASPPPSDPLAPTTA